MTATFLLIQLLGLAVIAGGVVVAQRRLAARVVSRALRPEVAALQWQAAAMAAEITRRHRAREAFDADFFRTWSLSEPQLYPAVGSHLGLLSKGAIDRVGFFHAQLAAARERVSLAAAEGGFQPTPYRVLSALVRAFNHVQPWVEPHLDIATAMMPDLADASALLEELENAGHEPIAVAHIWADSCARPD